LTGVFFSDSVALLLGLVPTAVLGVILFFTGLELASLVHDVGKPMTTVKDRETGRLTSHGHEDEGVDPARRVLVDQMNVDRPSQGQVSEIILYLQQASRRTTR